jgi:flagellar motor switch protein FliG
MRAAEVDLAQQKIVKIVHRIEEKDKILITGTGGEVICAPIRRIS